MQVSVPTRLAGHPVRSLAPTSQVAYQSFLHKTVDLAERSARIPPAEVVAPAAQMRVDPLDQLRDRHEALLGSGHFPQFVPFSLHRLGRGTEVQVAMVAPLQVTV